jgi:methionyl-tRNA formyltransferase
MKVVFFGSSTSAFSNRHFAALVESPCSLVAVVDAPAGAPTSTNPSKVSGSFVDYAAGAAIPVYAPQKPNAQDFVETLAALKPDLFIAIGYTGIMRSPLLAVPRILPVNFHASLLPAYRGLHPLYWALHKGEQYAGLTVHVMDEGIDTGDILYQVQVPVEAGDTVATLYDRVMAASVPLVPRLIADAIAGLLVRQPQGTEGASYYGHITQESSRS